MIARAQRYFEGIRDRDVMLILIGFFLGAVGVSVSAHFLSREVNLWVWLDSFTQNFGTEMFGGFLTFLLIEVVRGSRREREAAEREAEEKRKVAEREVEELKQELIRKMGSDVRDVAVPAVEDLRAHGWLTDGSLKGANLGRASLQRADLREADLRMATLFEADLQGADLGHANLQRAFLSMAKLQKASLWRINLQGAYMGNTNLQGARLGQANLQGALLLGSNLQEAFLKEANLQEANLEGVEFNEETRLPDGTLYNPELGLEQMTRFTDPAHPDFWRSDDPESPAYRGDDEETSEA